LESIHNTLEEDGIDHDDYDNLQCMASASINHIVECLQGNITVGNTLRKSIKDDRDLVLFKKGATIKSIMKDLILRTQNLNSSYPERVFKEVSNMLASDKKTHKVVFSTNPWDILTMSMRGIDSCMEWGSTHRNCLIGSVLDPYLGVMYVTNGQRTSYGSHMNFRSVVRLVKKKNGAGSKGKFHLYVEGAYPNDDDEDTNFAVTEMFRSVLAKRIKNNSRIESVVKTSDSYSYYVPYTVQTRGAEYRTYFDSALSYQ
jgi:hypothetical protein